MNNFEKKYKWLMNKCSMSLIIKDIQIKTSFEILSHPSQNGYYQGSKQQECWQGCRERKNPLTVLVRMQISATAMEISMEMPSKNKGRTAIPFFSTFKER
jgi:hypothetical protein